MGDHWPSSTKDEINADNKAQGSNIIHLVTPEVSRQITQLNCLIERIVEKFSEGNEYNGNN